MLVHSPVTQALYMYVGIHYFLNKKGENTLKDEFSATVVQALHAKKDIFTKQGSYLIIQAVK